MSLPMGALDALHVAAPAVRVTELQSVVAPMAKLTVPVGVPCPPETVAV